MSDKTVRLISATALLVSVSACSFTAGQIADKARETQLLKPGALDARITNVYDVYQFRFLDNYRVTHEWPRNSNGCKYRSLPAPGVKSTTNGEFYLVPDIYGRDGSLWQASTTGRQPWNFDRFVRSVKKMRKNDVYGVGKDGKRVIIAGSDANGYTEKEEGLEPVCFEAWVGTSHSLSLRLHKRTLPQWQEALRGRSIDGVSTNPYSNKSNETVSANTWLVYRSELRPRVINTIGGPFELWILPIGTSGYTIAVQLGANQDSLQYPQVHGAFQTTLRHLIESVKIEEINSLPPTKETP